jgi:hypothetical protein
VSVGASGRKVRSEPAHWVTLRAAGAIAPCARHMRDARCMMHHAR